MNQQNPHSIKSEIKSTFSLSVPLIASQLVYACTGFISTTMVAHLGKNALAASVLVSMIWFTLSIFFFGILNAVSILISHQYGAKNNNAISKIMGQAYLLGIFIIASLILILCCVPFFLKFSAQPQEVLILAKQYLYSLFWTLPGLITLIINEQFLTGIGRAKIVLRISLLVVPIEIPLIYVLVFGKLHLPTCGIAGIGYGLAITYTLSAISLLFYLFKSKQYSAFKIFARVGKINFKFLKLFFQIGLPMGFMSVIEVSTFAVTTLWMGHFGTTSLAAHQLALQYLSFAITLVFAMSQAVTIRVGHAVGRQDLMGAKYAASVGMLLNFCCISLVAIAFYFIPEIFFRLDLNINNPANATLIHDASSLMSIAGILLIFDNFRIIGFGALRGLKDTRFPMLASFIGFWLVGLTSAYVFSFIWDMQAEGIWYGLTLGIAVGAIVIILRLRNLLRRLTPNYLAELSAIS